MRRRFYGGGCPGVKTHRLAGAWTPCYKATPMEKILIDGYNLLYKDGALKEMAERSLEEARELLLDSISAYRTGAMEILVVFDGAGSSPTGSRSGRAGV